MRPILNSDSLIVMVLKLEPFNAHSTKNNGNWLPVFSISVSIQFPSEHFIKVSCLFELSKLRYLKFCMLLKCFRGTRGFPNPTLAFAISAVHPSTPTWFVVACQELRKVGAQLQRVRTHSLLLTAAYLKILGTNMASLALMRRECCTTHDCGFERRRGVRRAGRKKC